MTCRDAGLREETAFMELERAVAHRRRIDARMAILDDHWQGYEAALTDLEAAIQVYSLALAELREARAHHYDPNADPIASHRPASA